MLAFEGHDLLLHILHPDRSLGISPGRDPVDAVHDVEDQPHCGPGGRLSFLVRDGFLERLECSSKLFFRQGVDQKSQAHDHGQRHDPPLGL